ncbi:hypothetical protein [Staphylococcus pseudintermedius]|nr:hypothetical protein [Staphylococcus pseudintermedius]
MSASSGLLYSQEHEWVNVEGNTLFRSITDFSQCQLGDIVFVDLRQVEDE